MLPKGAILGTRPQRVESGLAGQRAVVSETFDSGARKEARKGQAFASKQGETIDSAYETDHEWKK